ncbi:MAG TPA: indole-3-glycerol phosphate synthase TrpC [Vicinamibacterales bacterium]|nr:indole-3-glycerol phosphate synthase TrpC [Vicinamibacterales bacterium]
MTSDLLSTVVAAARRAADEREARGALPAGVPGGRRPDGARFRQALTAPGIRVIAECKRRSPSRGVLRAQYDPAALAQAYAASGAAAVSVLTEPTFFDGSLAHLGAVRAVVDLPLLRKDFLVTEYQITEAATAGADAVLLIVAAMPRSRLEALLVEATRHGLAALVEVHDAAELEYALAADATIVGVNSRNLRTLEVHVSTFDALAPRIPSTVVAVAESGLRTGAELGRLAGLRYDAFLLGERLVTSPDAGGALADLLASAGVP